VMAGLDQGAHLCILLLHQIDTAKLLPFNWNTALLNSFCIFYQIFGRNSLDTFLKKNPPYIAACEKCDWSTISVAS